MSRSGAWRGVVCLIGGATALAVACSGGHIVVVPPPPPLRAITTAGTVPDLGVVAVPGAPGKVTTTAVPLAPGAATLAGQVTGPDGPVGGATVRIERLVGDQVGQLDILTAADGTWQLPVPPPPPATVATVPGQVPVPTAAPATTTTLRPLGPTGILGGRYRIRAWRSPDLSLTSGQVLFLGGTEHKTLSLGLSRYQGVGVSLDIAPNPPVVATSANLLVFVTTRTVDQQGVVRSLGVANTPLTLGSSTLAIDSAPLETDGAGRAIFRVRCRFVGPMAGSLVVDGTSYALDLPGCVEPPPTTTTDTTTPGDTVAGSSSSSVSSSSSSVPTPGPRVTTTTTTKR